MGDINSGQDIVIPAGVRIYTAAGVNGPVYLSTAVTLPAAASSMFFSATALYAGAAGNGAAGIFSTSNFTNYTESRFGSLLVTNNYGIVGGRDAESDDDYRYRIRLKLQSPNGANEAALLLRNVRTTSNTTVVSVGCGPPSLTGNPLAGNRRSRSRQPGANEEIGSGIPLANADVPRAMPVTDSMR